MIVEGYISMSSDPLLVLLVINVILLIAGTFMETTAIMIILVPLLWPVAQGLGIDVVHFGILVTVNTAIGLMTPPFGVCLFTTSSVSGVPLEKLSREVLVFLGAMIVALLIITFIPQSVMFLVH
jgi:C4-dicarboxylate transporter DctM subunit